MPKVKLYNVAGEAAGEIELNDSVFGVDYNEAVIHQAVVRQMANERLGNRRAPAVPESDPSAPHCGSAVVPYSDRPREAMPKICRERHVSWL